MDTPVEYAKLTIGLAELCASVCGKAIFCSDPKYRSVICIEVCRNQEANLLQVATSL